jgi:predicted DNA-binding protein YlxM (UPF0122 family)
MFDWKYNLLEYLSNFVEREVSQAIQNKDFSPERYYQVLNQKQVRFINNYDFCSLTGTIPLELLDLNDLHKQAIEDFCRKICLGLPEFAYYLKLLSKILCDYESAQGIEKGEDFEYETLEARTIEQVYYFVRAIFSERFPDKALELQQRVAHKAKSETENPRPVCIECGSTHITSNGPLWFCQSCGRKFSKRPRRKQKL